MVLGATPGSPAGPGRAARLPRVHPALLPTHLRWLYALKPGSWPKLLVAAALGQGIGVATTGVIDLRGLLVGGLFTVLLLAFIVLINDWGDQDVDEIKRRLYPDGCSPKTIPDGVLDPGAVLLAGVGAGVLAIAVAGFAELWLDRAGLAMMALSCLGLLVLYTLPPLRLNYRGGGELLEMLGVGLLLPWWNAIAQGGEPSPATIVVLPAFALLCLSSALASGLADEHSDRLGGKKTFTTMFGPDAVRQSVEGLVVGAILVWGGLPWLAPQAARLWMVLPVVVVMSIDLFELWAHDHSVGDPMHRRYKYRLHQCIWRGGLMMTAMLCLAGLVGAGSGALP